MRRSWFGGVVKQNKSPSLDLLKSLYGVLLKNSILTDNNKNLIIEVLRSIAETVIWGDQNDPRVFDYFLEKGIQSYFLNIIEQPKCGTYVCTQLLQTLNILFENIRNETSIYFLLSNNHVNSIICHEFDFSDEEIMAYYISFLKTLSLKLNQNTIHFFYNEHLRDFPLYTEAIKFFNHSESMVRIAVRTLTLNVYKVGDEATLKFIHDKTAAPYFSNLVWFIGNNVLMMERCLRTEATHLTRNKLEALVALHLDDIHYVHDIMQIQSLNTMLCEHLLNTLFIPLYVYSLDPGLEVDSPQVSVKCALFLLSQVFLILSHPPLVKQLKLYICFEENPHLESSETVRKFTKPMSKIQDTLKPAVIPKNQQNLMPTPRAKEHREELRRREAKRLAEEERLKDLERYQNQQRKEEFSQTGYLKSILDPDHGIDPLLGTKVHRVDSLKNLGDAEALRRSRESSTISKESSIVFVDSEDCKTESFTELTTTTSHVELPGTSLMKSDGEVERDRDGIAGGTGSRGEPIEGAVFMRNEEDAAHHVEYPVSEDSGIVSETMENVLVDDVIDEEHTPESRTGQSHLERAAAVVPAPGQTPVSDLEGDVTVATVIENEEASSASSSSSVTPTTNAPCAGTIAGQPEGSLDDNRYHGNADPSQREDTITNANNEEEVEVPEAQEVSCEGSDQTTPRGGVFTPTSPLPQAHLEEENHFTDAFHATPDRSCIFYDALLSCMELGEDDTEAVFSAALLYAMFTNTSMPYTSPAPYYYDDRIIDRLLNILEKACHPDSIVRLVTVEVAVRLLVVLTKYDDKLLLRDHHIAVLTAIKENSIRHLRTFYTGDDDTLFIELFDEEYRQFVRKKDINVAHLMSDECMLLGPVYTPLTGIDFTKRLPCGDIEKMRKSLIVFFTIRKFWQQVLQEEESELPLLNLSLQVSKGDILNLNNSDLIACTVVTESDMTRRFLVIDTHQLILVEPDNAPTRLGHGIVQFVAPLQFVDAKPDKDNNRNLLITVEKNHANLKPLKARFQFEDHIRCFAAKTRLKQGRESLQKLKAFKLTRILNIPDQFSDEPFVLSSRAAVTPYQPTTTTPRPSSPPFIGKTQPEVGSMRASPDVTHPKPHTTSDIPPSSPATNKKPSLSKLPDPEDV